jgi:TM2 domain-containing membrane protein YozV
MKILITIYWITLISLLNNFSSWAQSVDYPNAALQLEYKVFSEKKEVEKIDALIQKAELLKSNKLFADAAQTLSRIDIENLADSLQQKILYEIMLNSYLAEQYVDAKNYMIQYDNYLKDTTDKYHVNWLKCLIFLNNDDFENAHLKLIAAVKPDYKKTADSIFVASFPKLKNEKKASRLSTFLPGSGQMYAGKIGFGLVNLLSVAGAGYFTAWHIAHQYYLIAAFTGGGLMSRFYLGGLKTSKNWAQQKNAKATNQFKIKISNLLLNNLSD